MNRKPALLSLILVIFMAACSAAPAPKEAVAPSMPGQVPSASYGGASDKAVASSADSTQSERLVIKNAEISIVVTDPGSGLSSILKMASEMGGYVVSSRLYKTTTKSGLEVPQANLTVRVPSEKLDEALAKIKALVRDPATDILSENVTGKDVTAEFVDLQSRLKNLENTEAQLKKIQDAATKTEDVLSVFNRLTEIRAQIEQVKGQIKYYQESTNLSAISVQLVSKESVAPISIGGWEPVGVARDAFQTLIDVGKVLVELVIWLVIFFAPLGLVFFFPIRWAWRRFRRWQARRPVYPPYPPQAPQPYTPMPPYPPAPPPPQEGQQQ